MRYRVALAANAAKDAGAIYAWVTAQAPLRGPSWFEELLVAMYSLEHSPARCPLAREARRTKRKIRCLLFGKNRYAFRILYEVDEKDHAVWILHIRRASRGDIDPADLSTRA